jgi:hypothetical protein
VTVSGTIQAISETKLDLDMESTNAEGADCGIGIATLPAHVAMTPALDDVPAGPVDQRRIPVSWEAIVVGEPLPSFSLTVVITY